MESRALVPPRQHVCRSQPNPNQPSQPCTHPHRCSPMLFPRRSMTASSRAPARPAARLPPRFKQEPLMQGSRMPTTRLPLQATPSQEHGGSPILPHWGGAQGSSLACHDCGRSVRDARRDCSAATARAGGTTGEKREEAMGPAAPAAPERPEAGWAGYQWRSVATALQPGSLFHVA